MSYAKFKQRQREKAVKEQQAREIQARWEAFGKKIRGIYDSDEITDKPDVIIPIIRWVLYNFEKLRDEALGLLNDGTGFKDYTLGYPKRYGDSPSVADRYLIGSEKCKQIIESVQNAIDKLNPELFDILIKYFWDGLPIWKVAKILQTEGVKISERTVKRRIRDVYSLVIQELAKDNINYYNLYWFRLRFECIGRGKNYDQNNKDAA